MYSEQQQTGALRPFRICDNCGRLTPSNLPQCVNCGALSARAVVAEQQARQERRFLQALFQRATPVTNVLIVLNVILFVVMSWVNGGNRWEALFYGADYGVLVAFGAKTNGLLQAGEWFRLITPIFLHIGLLHLVLNSYALWNIGPMVERLYGSARYLLLYLLTGVGGNLASWLSGVWRQDNITVGAGASGAIFGLFGVLAVFGYRYRSELPPGFSQAIKRGVLPVIAINLLIGYSLRFVDNSAHVGGLLAGAILTLLIPYLPPGAKRVSLLGLVLLAVCTLTVAVSLVAAYQHRAPHLARRETPIDAFIREINQSQENFEQAAQTVRQGADASAFLPKLSQSVAALGRLVPLDQESDVLIEELKRVLATEQDLIEKRASQQEFERNEDAYSEVSRRLENWVRSAGGKFGLQIESDDKQNK